MLKPSALLIALMITAAPAAAQSMFVAGRVADDSGAALPGVAVVVKSSDPPATLETVTGTDGWYRVDLPNPGTYEARFSLINFGPATRTFTVAVGEPAQVHAVLPVVFTADVTVTGRRTFRNLADVDDPGASLIGLASAASEGAITATQLQHRPLAQPGDTLESVPGMVVSQHSGEGKANQYYLRGFNLDHGTDFAVAVAGVPVNMPSHGHGQGWSDLNFVIPELVSGIQFKKGPYYAEEGDFSTAGAANVNYVSTLDRPIELFSIGPDRFRRTLSAVSPPVGRGHLLAAFETLRSDGPWDNPQKHGRLNGVVRYSQGDSRQGSSMTAMGYFARWIATDQIPQRAVDNGLVSRFGTLDSSNGGTTHRFTLSAEMQRSGFADSTKVVGYVMESGLDLFSNFTYNLNDPINGDQFEQVDRRFVTGTRLSHRRQGLLFGRHIEHGLGLKARHDRIGALGLYSTVRRQRQSAVREDRVGQSSVGVYYQAELEFTDRVRATGGLRVDVYRFSVRSDRAENSGADIAALLSPKVGLVFAPSRKLELYGNYGHGFHSNDARGVTLAIDPVTGDPADRVTPLAGTRGGEIGLRTVLIPKVQSTVAVWGLGLDSELVFLGDAGTTEAGRPSRRRGIEWTNYFSARRWLTFEADLSWSSARFTDGDAAGQWVPGAVREVVAIGASMHDWRRMSAGVRLRYVGPRPLVEDGSVSSPSSFLVNMEAAYALAPRTRLVVDVLNLFNARTSDVDYYYASRLPGEPVAGVADVHMHPVQPRTVRFGIQVGL